MHASKWIQNNAGRSTCLLRRGDLPLERHGSTPRNHAHGAGYSPQHQVCLCMKPRRSPLCLRSSVWCRRPRVNEIPQITPLRSGTFKPREVVCSPNQVWTADDSLLLFRRWYLTHLRPGALFLSDVRPIPAICVFRVWHTHVLVSGGRDWQPQPSWRVGLPLLVVRRSSKIIVQPQWRQTYCRDKAVLIVVLV